ncbi:MAG: hypothetical protein JSS27_18865 [Planctomycetes bacterium]|nr:hypothetical protein [Planctomycetota bacterium]
MFTLLMCLASLGQTGDTPVFVDNVVTIVPLEPLAVTFSGTQTVSIDPGYVPPADTGPLGLAQLFSAASARTMDSMLDIDSQANLMSWATAIHGVVDGRTSSPASYEVRIPCQFFPGGEDLVLTFTTGDWDNMNGVGTMLNTMRDRIRQILLAAGLICCAVVVPKAFFGE